MFLEAEDTGLKVELDAETASAHYNDTLKKLATRLSMKGFRPGKVPTFVAERHFGKEAVKHHMIRYLLPQLQKMAGVGPETEIESFVFNLGEPLEVTFKS